MIFWKYLLPIHKCRKKRPFLKTLQNFLFQKTTFSFLKIFQTFYFKETLEIHTKITSN